MKKYKIGQVLINTLTREFWIVVGANKFGVTVINLNKREDPPLLHVVLKRDLDHWAKDEEVSTKELQSVKQIKKNFNYL